MKSTYIQVLFVLLSIISLDKQFLYIYNVYYTIQIAETATQTFMKFTTLSCYLKLILKQTMNY